MKQRFWFGLLLGGLSGISLLLLGLIVFNLRDYTVLKNRLSQLPLVETIVRTFKTEPKTMDKAVPIKILFVGDMMFDRYIRSVAEVHGYDFVLESIAPFLQTYDLVVGNLESPITENASISQNSEIGSPKNYIFTTSPGVLETMKKNKILLVSLGNNHIGNFGPDGIASTSAFLGRSDISFFGFTTQPLMETRIVKQFGDVNVGFANYNQFVDGGFEQALTDVEVLKPNADVLVLYAHWDNEYQTTPAKVTVERAHAFVDAGVDVIIGSHPHVISSTEEYKGKMIYYSLGNFVFDQYFSPETKRGLLVEMAIDPETDKLQFTEFFSETLSNGKTILITQ